MHPHSSVSFPLIHCAQQIPSSGLILSSLSLKKRKILFHFASLLNFRPPTAPLGLGFRRMRHVNTDSREISSLPRKIEAMVGSTKYEIAQTAYVKLVLHALKHKTNAVNGVLIGRVSGASAESEAAPAAANGNAQGKVTVEIVDCVPLFHNQLGLLPMLELALTQVGFSFSRPLLNALRERSHSLVLFFSTSCRLFLFSEVTYILGDESHPLELCDCCTGITPCVGSGMCLATIKFCYMELSLQSFRIVSGNKSLSTVTCTCMST